MARFLICFFAASSLAAAEGLSPQNALRSFVLEPGLRLELVAAEPQVISPVAMAFDENGHLYVAENRDYPTGPGAGKSPEGTIALLKDVDGDGRFETRFKYASGLTYPNGVLPWRGGVFVTCAPDLLYLKDTNGDGKADVKRTVLTGFSTRSTTQLRVSHPTFGPDGWIYLTSGLGMGGKVNGIEFTTDSRFNPFTSAFEPIEGKSQYGMSFDDAGHRFICMNRVHVQHVVIPERYLRRNPALGVSEAIHNCPAEMMPEPLKGHGRAARVYPISKNVTTADSHAGTFTAACAVFVYRGTGLPAAYSNSIFACEPTGNLVHRDQLIPSGTTFIAKPTSTNSEFLASTDNWFRPVFLSSGPDGALYVCDMYRKTIEHPEYLPEEVRKRTDFESGKGMGRIYRISSIGKTSWSLPNDPSSALDHANDWTRETARRLLLEKSLGENGRPTPGAPQLVSRIRGSRPLPLEALRVMSISSNAEAKEIVTGLQDSSPAIRITALRMAEERLRSSPTIRDAALHLLDDPDPHVRLQLVLSLGECPEGETNIIRLAKNNAEDRWMRLAAISSLHGKEERALNILFSQLPPFPATNTAGLCYLLTELARAARSTRSLAKILAQPVDARWKIAAIAGVPQSPEQGSSLSSLIPLAASIATNSAEVIPLRIGAAYILASSEPSLLIDLLQRTEANELQIAVVRILVRNSAISPAPELLAARRWNTYTPALREALLNALLSEARHIPAVLAAIERGALSSSSLDSSRRRQLVQHKDVAIRERATRLLGANVVGDRMNVYNEWKTAATMGGRSERGRLIFGQHCASCHRLDGEGANVGPDLFGIRNQPKEAILLHIIVPEQEVAPGFTAYEIEMKDGRSQVGIIIAETTDSITLRSGQGIEEIIPRTEIASLASQGLSLMPQEMEKSMTRQDMADLLAFLKGE